MGYKDKQREANRERQRRYKAKQKALPDQGVTGALPQGVTITPTDAEVDAIRAAAGTLTVEDIRCRPANFGQPDCQCKHCQQNRAQGSRHIINHGPYKEEYQLSRDELNRVALPGDADYVGVAV